MPSKIMAKLWPVAGETVPADVAADVIAQIRHARPAAARAPSSSRSRVAFDSTFIAIPKLDLRVCAQGVQALQISGALGFILPLGPALRHAQVVVRVRAGSG